MAEIYGIDDHADVGGVLAAHLGLGNIDELDSVGVKLAHVLAIVAPIAVGALVYHAPLFEEAIEHELDSEGLCPFHIPHAEGEVLEIDEDCDREFVHVPS